MLSVVMPAYNESAYLSDAVHAVHAGLAANGEPFEIVVVENGSSDGTWDVLAGLAAELPQVRAVHQDEANYGAALRLGLLTAAGAEVALFDVDYYDLDFMRAAVARIRSSPRTAVVVGSKRGEDSVDRRPWYRRLITAVFGFVIQSLFGGGIPDTHGMKVLDRAAVLPLVNQCGSQHDLFDSELILRGRRAGYAVEALPVEVRELRAPRSSVLRRVPRTLVGLARLRWTLWRESTSPAWQPWPDEPVGLPRESAAVVDGTPAGQ